MTVSSASIQYQYTMQYNTNLLYRTMANMYIVSPCIYTHRSSNVICTYTWSTVHYRTPYIFRHECTALQHDSSTLRLYLKTIYILGEKHTVHIILTVHSTRMKIQMHSTLRSRSRSRPKSGNGHGHSTLLFLLFIQYWFTVYNGVLVHYIYVAYRYKIQVPCTVLVYIG